jgi:very-short-patch-repair endonuclease
LAFGCTACRTRQPRLSGCGIGIEADGKEPHSGLRPVFTDRCRTNALVGWQLLRFTWYDVLRRPAYVVATARAHHRGAA